MAELDLTGRVGFVTGGTRGIGLATAQLLAAHGASLAIAGRGDASPVAERIAAEYGVRVIGMACDSRDPEQITGTYRTLRTEFGRLDFLVNNAGVMQGALIGMIPADVVDEAFAVNASGPLHHLQGAARLMRKGGGSIVNLTSIMGVRGYPGQAVYSASKAAVIGMTVAAAKELAPKGIRVNAVAPGLIDTDMTAGLSTEERQQRLDGIAMGRIGTPYDVATTILFLVSDLSTYVTGQVIGVDGGMQI